ncbi:MAG TPA: cellulase family glycosylhydrolase [Nitrososphaeraceae archaeon]|nr:cellulase family glycosylhydrolase [Nitrososphaeraceae archaeon]
MKLSVFGISFVFLLILNISLITNLGNAQDAKSQPLIGVNMLGYYTSLPQSRDFKNPFPDNYYDQSFKIIKDGGMNHVRYVYYWESFVKNPVAFINELKFAATLADTYGLKIIYDNHQFHTSSWLNPQRGTGFPHFLFQNNSGYAYGSGGSPQYPSAVAWWSDWWNREITDANGTDGWSLQSQFLKKIVNTVDSHPSTVGYEILSEPQVHDVDQWDKVGKYNTFMTDELRNVTNKNIVFSMSIPVDLESNIGVNATNLAKMTPVNKTNTIFKFSIYGLPSAGSYQEERLNMFLATGNLSGVPVYIGEWNNVARDKVINEEGDFVYEIDPEASDITPEDTTAILKKFNEIDPYGWAFWYWNFRPHRVENFNLVTSDTNGNLIPTKYFDILKNAVQSVK